MKKLLALLNTFEKKIAWVESLIITVVILLIVGIGVFQILGRNFFNFALPGMDVLLRALVLWITFFGASLATSRKRHIAIDALNKFLPKRPVQILTVCTGLLSITICILLTNAAMDFVLSEKTAATIFIWGIPAWIVELILPIGFGLISFKFLLVSLEEALQ